jgi:hypothetical protein
MPQVGSMASLDQGTNALIVTSDSEAWEATEYCMFEFSTVPAFVSAHVGIEELAEIEPALHARVPMHPEEKITWTPPL